MSLASAADDLRVWDGNGYDDLIKHYSPDVQKISSLSWNSINSQIASTSLGGCAIDITYLDLEREPTSYPILDEAICLCWHNSSRYIGMGCIDGNVKVYDLQTRMSKKTYTGHKGPVTCITYNYNDTSIASASKTGEIILHNTVTDLTTKLITTLKLQAIQGIQYSLYHHSMLASVSDDASLVLWDTSARRSVHQFTRSHKAPATDLAFSSGNDKLLLSCGLDKNIVLYDVLSKSIVRTMQVDAPLSAISMHTNGYQIASGTIKGQVLLHDLRKGSQVQHSFTAHRSSVQSLAFQNKIVPRKSKSSQSISLTRSSMDGGVTGNSESKLTAPPPEQQRVIPLKPVDQNAKADGVDRMSEPKPTHSEHVADSPVRATDMREDHPPSTPYINGQNSSAMTHSIFSPDVPGNESQSSSMHELNHSMKSLQNGSVHRDSGASIFSPDMPSGSLFSGSSAHCSAPANSNSTSKPALQKTAASTSRVFSSTPSMRRELPLPPSPLTTSQTAARQSSPPTTRRQPTSTVHFTPPTAGHARGGNAHNSHYEGAVGGEELLDPLRQRIKEELKQELKSEIVNDVKDLIDDMKDDIKQSVMEHHFEMIKQFFMMQLHVETQTAHHSVNFDLLRENEELKAEIERLKRTY